KHRQPVRPAGRRPPRPRRRLPAPGPASPRHRAPGPRHRPRTQRLTHRQRRARRPAKTGTRRRPGRRAPAGGGLASTSWPAPSWVMALRWTLGCDAADPQALASFWAFALGYVKEPGFDEPDNASIIDPEGRGPAVGFLQVPEGKTAKNRMHIDIRVAGEGPWDM